MTLLNRRSLMKRVASKNKNIYTFTDNVAHVCLGSVVGLRCNIDMSEWIVLIELRDTGIKRGMPLKIRCGGYIEIVYVAAYFCKIIRESQDYQMSGTQRDLNI